MSTTAPTQLRQTIHAGPYSVKFRRRSMTRVHVSGPGHVQDRASEQCLAGALPGGSDTAGPVQQSSPQPAPGSLRGADVPTRVWSLTRSGWGQSIRGDSKHARSRRRPGSEPESLAATAACTYLPAARTAGRAARTGVTWQVHDSNLKCTSTADALSSRQCHGVPWHWCMTVT